MDTLQNIIGKIEKFADPKLASFDYVGLLQGESNQQIRKIGLTLDYSLQAIQKAVGLGCSLLITHHGPTDILYPLMGNNLAKVQLATKHSLAVYRCHLNLDFCEGGIIEELCKLLKIPAQPFTTTFGNHQVKGGVRIAKNYPLSLDELLERVKILGHPYVRLAGRRRESFKQIAITSGKGFISEFFDQLHPEVYIAGEFEQEATKYAEDLGIMLVELSHHASESKPLQIIANTLSKLLEAPVQHIEIPDTIQCVQL